jgi:rRNA-processing protein FCF1
MKKVAIQDANILIDLLKADLFELCLLLDYHFCTTDLILAELYDVQSAFLAPFIEEEKFRVIAVSEEALLEINKLSVLDSRLSEQDWSAYYFAQQENTILLTGDKRLKSYAISKGIIANGVLWVFDQLVESACITKEDACSKLRLMMSKNKRLPLNECESRLRSWSE